MSTLAPPPPAPPKDKATPNPTPKKSKPKFKEQKAQSQPHSERDRLKTVVRRLPPNLPEDIFWGSVAQWVNDQSVSWKCYYPGKARKRLGKENIPSRAYIAFRTEEQLTLFGREYDGHLFRDKAGNEFQAVVEFAPYQKVPSDKRRPDPRNNTIEKDEDYISFLEMLEASKNAEPQSFETLLALSQAPAQPKTTPLLEALKAEKTAYKDKETILRSHAHYRDPTAILAPPAIRGDAAGAKKKGKEKEKEVAVPKGTVPGEGSGKKGKKAQTQAQGKGPQTQPPRATQQQQQQQQQPTQTSNKPPGESAGGSGGAKPAKPPRPPRPPKVKPQPPATTANPNPSTSTVTAIATPPAPAGISPSTSTSQATAAGPPRPAAAARRTRPVIGLASRQFEAALSGVAGAGSPRSASSRKEQQGPPEAVEKQKDTLSTANSGKPPTSPRRSRKEKEPGQLPVTESSQNQTTPGQSTAAGVGGEEAGHGAGSRGGARRGRGRGGGGRGAPRGS